MISSFHFILQCKLGRGCGIWSKSPVPKSPFAKSLFAERLMVKRALYNGNQIGLLSVYRSVDIDKKVLDWF